MYEEERKKQSKQKNKLKLNCINRAKEKLDY
jgi:hypothetical protein